MVFLTNTPLNGFLSFISRNHSPCPATFYESVNYCVMYLTEMALNAAFLDSIFIA